VGNNVNLVVQIGFVVNIFAALWYADSNRCAGGVDASWGAWGRLSKFLEAS